MRLEILRVLHTFSDPDKRRLTLLGGLPMLTSNHSLSWTDYKNSFRLNTDNQNEKVWQK